MAWYRTGTVALTNGSPVVTGTGTAFVANVQPGHAINLPDGRAYEVLSVQSDTQLTLGNPNGYLGATANGQAYSVQPNQGFAQTAATRLADFLSQFGGYVATVLAGLFPDGTLGRPGIAFANDQDTGARRKGDNAFALVSGGVDALDIKSDATIGFPRGISGNTGFGTTAATSVVHASGANATQVTIESTSGNGDTGFAMNTPSRKWNLGQNIGGVGAGSFNLFDVTRGASVWLADTAGNMLFGPGGSSGFHQFYKPIAQGGSILQINNAAGISGLFRSVDGGGFSTAEAAQWIGKNTSTGRSINAGGTINASGADYAEYMTKAEGCGPIAKGDVCGVDRDGKLTRTWAHALSFMVKSTDPNLVGGDAWSQHLGPRPEVPGDAPVAPVMSTPPEGQVTIQPFRKDGEDDATFAQRMAAYLLLRERIDAASAAYWGAREVYDAQMQAYPGELAKFAERYDAYQRELLVWAAALEAARATVDRIAYCGQTPVNVDADTLAACEAALNDGAAVYLVAVANGGGIGVKAVREADMTIGDYMRRIGKVLRIEADRPVVDVQHG